MATIYSDDQGRSWQRGELVPNTLKHMSESVAVELTDGRVMLNIRSEDPAHRRGIAYSQDGVSAWTPPELHPELYEPICMASMIRLSARPAASKNRILFANPDSRSETRALNDWGGRPRENVTIKMSYDEGQTWAVSKVLEPGRSGYSDLAVGPDGTIYCLYERGAIEGSDTNMKHLTVARFNLEWLTDGTDSLGDGEPRGWRGLAP